MRMKRSIFSGCVWLAALCAVHSLAARPCGTGEVAALRSVPADAAVAAYPAGPDGAPGVADSIWSGRSAPGVGGAVGLSGLHDGASGVLCPSVGAAEPGLSAYPVPSRRPLDRRIHRGYASWERVAPTHLRLQYAGSIGIASAGMGWDYGRRGQWETELLVGVVPAYHSDKAKITLTLRETFVPWSIACGGRLSVEPLACGFYFSTLLSDRFWVRQPERYPKGYYFFSTRLRSYVFLGPRVTCRVNDRRSDRLLRAVTFCCECSTCDLYVLSRWNNRTLRARDMLSLSFGVKFQLFDSRREVCAVHGTR